MLAHTAAARDYQLCRLWVLGSLFLHHFPCVIRHSLAQTRSTLTQLLESSALSVGTDMDRRHRTPFRIRAIQHLLRRPTQLRAWARRAPRRYGIWKVYLVGYLFSLLDITKRGVLGMDELFLLAMFTGSQGHSDELQDCIAHLLDTWGSPVRDSEGRWLPYNMINGAQFRRILSHSGPLHMWKFELRRTIRFIRESRPAWAVTTEELILCRRFIFAKARSLASHWRLGNVWNRYDPTRNP